MVVSQDQMSVSVMEESANGGVCLVRCRMKAQGNQARKLELDVLSTTVVAIWDGDLT
jgi:hypothetical protein